MLPLETFNQIVALGALAMQIVTTGLFIAYLLRNRFSFLKDVIHPIAAWGLWIALGASFFASAMSLYYELVVGYPPCILCWWQRIFMYPQVVLFAIALWTKDRTVTLYSLVFSLLGLLIGVYNHVLQILPGSGLPCPSQGVSCAQIFYLEFGYITIPMLAITFFAFLIVIMLIARERRT